MLKYELDSKLTTKTERKRVFSDGMRLGAQYQIAEKTINETRRALNKDQMNQMNVIYEIREYEAGKKQIEFEYREMVS